jgi:sugar phosphate isomerase/epimerase
MKIGLFTVLFNDKPLEEVADYAAGLGYEMFELAAWRGSNHFDTDRAAEDPAYAKGIKKMLAERGIEISGLSNHLFSQMVLPFSDASLDEWAGTSDKEEMVKLGTEHIIKTAQVASELEVPIVNGFFGSTVWESWYIWPPQRLAVYEAGWDLFVERWNPILDEFAKLGVRFAHEVHPTEIAYNVYTAEEAIKRLDRDDWGFNFDPSHLIWQMIDPVVFIKKFGNRIFHAHAKDWELQKDILHIDGVTGTGSWQRPDRAARYRVPGWGDVEWKRVMTALLEVGYDYVLSFEHEDPVMSEEDGCEQCISFLKPLIIKKPLGPDSTAWWLA